MKVQAFSLASLLLLTGCAKVVVVPVPRSAAPQPAAAASGNNGSGPAPASAAPTPAPKVKAAGVFYALPRTVVKAQVKVERTERARAPYGKFAAIFAPGLDPVCKTDCADENRKMYSLKEGVVMTTIGEPDPDQVYLVKFAGGITYDQTVSMTWNELGLASTAAASVTNRTTDIVLSGLKLGAGLAQRAAFGLSETKAGKEVCVPAAANDDWIIAALRGGQLSNDIAGSLVGNYCFLEQKIRENNFNRTDDREPLRNAIEAYRLRVQELVTARSNILAGTTNTSDPAAFLTRVESMLKTQLDALYLGRKDTTVWDGVIDVRDFVASRDARLLAIDASKGVCTPADNPTSAHPHNGVEAPESKPFPEKFRRLKDAECEGARWVNLKVSLHPGADSQLFTAVQSRTTSPAGDLSFRYRIPAQVKAVVADIDNPNYGTAVFSVAQFGATVALPARHNSKTVSYDLAFLEATGALKSFKLGASGGLDAASIDALSGIGNSLYDASIAAGKAAKSERETKEAAAKLQADELTKLQRRASLLKAQDEICAVLIKNGYPCTINPE